MMLYQIMHATVQKKRADSTGDKVTEIDLRTDKTDNAQ